MQEQKIEINIKDEVAHGIYSNLVIVTHSNTEFIVDFISVMPGIPKGEVRSRIILTPQNAKRLLNALGDNITKFEEKNGEIQSGTYENFPTITNDGGLA